jgi:Alpha/beta hydrolase domain
VTQVDADGNDLDGIRNVFVQVPIGTYTDWNLFNRSFYEDGFCTLQGSFVPFARTKVERITTGYVRKTADGPVAKRYLLAEDATRFEAEAERDGIRAAP